MNVFVLLYNSGTDKEGIHSIELKGRTIVLMFEDKDDATRYCGLLEAQDFPLPTVEMICLLYTSPSPRDPKTSRMPSSA